LAASLDSSIAAEAHYFELRCQCERKQDPTAMCDVDPPPSARERACYARVLAFDETVTRPFIECKERAYQAASACIGTANSCKCKDVLKLYEQECAELPEKVEDALEECEDDETPAIGVAGAPAPATQTRALPAAGTPAVPSR
jgi:hypothetical protein